jgi:hypothetical protein
VTCSLTSPSLSSSTGSSSSLSPLPALRSATSAKLRLECDIARNQIDEILRLRQRCRDPGLWRCRLRRRSYFRLRRSLGQEKKVDSDFGASVLQSMQFCLLSIRVHLELCLLLLRQQQAVAVVVCLPLLLLQPQGLL